MTLLHASGKTCAGEAKLTHKLKTRCKAAAGGGGGKGGGGGGRGGGGARDNCVRSRKEARAVWGGGELGEAVRSPEFKSSRLQSTRQGVKGGGNEEEDGAGAGAGAVAGGWRRRRGGGGGEEEEGGWTEEEEEGWKGGGFGSIPERDMLSSPNSSVKVLCPSVCVCVCVCFGVCVWVS